jgi:hypothetical protein
LEKAEIEKRAENHQKAIKEEISIPSYLQTNPQLQESLKIISEETQQLSEFLLQEKRVIKEFCVLLKQILKQLNISFDLPSNLFPPTLRTQQIILNDEAHLVFIKNEKEVKTKALENFPPQVILNVILFIIPKISKCLTSYRKKVSTRLNIFNRINQELKNVDQLYVGHSRNFEDDINSSYNKAKKNMMTQPARRKGSDEEYGREKEAS